MNRLKGDQGVALVSTLLFLMAMGILSTALIFTVQNEMKSSASYKYSQQAFFVADTGVQKAVKWYNTAYAPELGSGVYDLTTSPPHYSGSNVIIAGRSDANSNYPSDTTKANFTGQFSETADAAYLEEDSSHFNRGRYALNASLLYRLSVQFISETNPSAPPTNGAIERWSIDSMGYWGTIANPLGIARITGIIENDGYAFFDRALWGINKVDLTGSSGIDSYDPTLPLPNSGNLGAIGSNLDVEGGGSSIVHGDVAIGPSGVLNIDPSKVTGSEFRLSAARNFAALPNFTTGATSIKVQVPDPDPNNPSSPPAKYPPGAYNKIEVWGTLTLPPGDYTMNELNVTSGGTLIITGDTKLYINNSLTMVGQAIAGDMAHPDQLTIYYGGSTAAKWAGGSGISSSIYAPSADLILTGSTEFFGSFIGKTVTVKGNAMVHFDEGNLRRNLIKKDFRLITWSQNTN
jgi:Tfp pilus assembly protein PilX